MAISTDALVALASGVVGIALGAAAGYCLAALATTVRFQRAATEDDAEKDDPEKQHWAHRHARLALREPDANTTNTTNNPWDKPWDDAERFGATDSPWDNIEIRDYPAANHETGEEG